MPGISFIKHLRNSVFFGSKHQVTAAACFCSTMASLPLPLQAVMLVQGKASKALDHIPTHKGPGQSAYMTMAHAVLCHF